MIYKYYNEIEAIFIKNVFLEMDRLKSRCNDKNVVKKTICFLIKYLNQIVEKIKLFVDLMLKN